MFTLKFYNEDGGVNIYQASQFKVQPPDPKGDSKAVRVEWEDPVANATFEEWLEPHDMNTMIAENSNGKTTDIIRA